MKTKLALLLGMVLMATLMLTACGGGTTVTTAVVKSVVMAKGVDANFLPVDPTTTFLPTDTIFVSTGFTGSPSQSVVNGKFYYGDQFISEATLDITKAVTGDLVSYNGDTYTAFNLIPSDPWPVAATYRFELYIDGVKVGEYPFAVVQ